MDFYTKERLETDVAELERMLDTIYKVKGANEIYRGKHLKMSGKYYTQTESIGGVTMQKYLGAIRSPEVQGISTNRLLERFIPIVEAEVKFKKWVLSHGGTTNPSVLAQTLARAYREQTSDFYEMIEVMDYLTWVNKDRKFSDHHPETKRYKTTSGWLVRSKSELVIANLLALHSIPFVYEEVHVIDGAEIATDFTLFSARRNVEVLWDHFGLMGDTRYLANFNWKMERYMKTGYIPGVNLITTFEYPGRGIDTDAIEKIIDTFF